MALTPRCHAAVLTIIIRRSTGRAATLLCFRLCRVSARAKRKAFAGETGVCVLLVLLLTLPLSYNSLLSSANPNCKLADGKACKRVIGYVTNWAHHRPYPWTFDVADIDSSKFTHLIFAFAELTSEYVGGHARKKEKRSHQPLIEDELRGARSTAEAARKAMQQLSGRGVGYVHATPGSRSHSTLLVLPSLSYHMEAGDSADVDEHSAANGRYARFHHQVS